MGWGGLLFAASSAVAIGWLAWCKVAWYWGAGFMAVIVLVTVGLMRVVAEGGIYWFQIHAARSTWSSRSARRRRCPRAFWRRSCRFIRCCSRNQGVHGARGDEQLQDAGGDARRAAVVPRDRHRGDPGDGCSVVRRHSLYRVQRGREPRRSEWFFKVGPQSLFDNTQVLVSGGAAGAGQHNWIYYLIGAGWVLLSIGMRRKFFWWLHPIGFVMMANPLIPALWFSFFLGWCCKKLAVRYGGRHMFARLRRRSSG